MAGSQRANGLVCVCVCVAVFIQTRTPPPLLLLCSLSRRICVLASEIPVMWEEVNTAWNPPAELLFGAGRGPSDPPAESPAGLIYFTHSFTLKAFNWLLFWRKFRKLCLCLSLLSIGQRIRLKWFRPELLLCSSAVCNVCAAKQRGQVRKLVTPCLCVPAFPPVGEHALSVFWSQVW